MKGMMDKKHGKEMDKMMKAGQHNKKKHKKGGKFGAFLKKSKKS